MTAPATTPSESDQFDAFDTRLSPYAHTFRRHYANHAPMALEALFALGRADAAEAMIDDWEPQLDLIDPDSAYAAHVARLRPLVDGDWAAAVADIATTRSTDGFAHIGHGVIRTGHAVRALQARDTVARRTELVHALAAWSDWSRPGDLPAAAGRAVDLVADLVRRAMAGYAEASGRDAFFRLHTVTTSVAVSRVVDVLPDELGEQVATAFLAAMADEIATAAIDAPDSGVDDFTALVEAAVATGDAHSIKLVDALVFPPETIASADPSRLAAAARLADDLGVVWPGRRMAPTS